MALPRELLLLLNRQCAAPRSLLVGRPLQHGMIGKRFYAALRQTHLQPRAAASQGSLNSDAVSDKDYESSEYSQAFLATGSVFARIFRYAVYASVFLVVSSACVWQGTNLWIENISMGKALPYIKDEYAWDEDDSQAWSGHHCGGGTDARLPFKARIAIRSAFSALLYGAGPLQVGEAGSTSGGGSFINKGKDAMQVPDAGYLSAERQLVYALEQAKIKQLTLPDRAVIELEERLASVRERIAGRIHLVEAKKGWERIWTALKDNPLDNDTQGWQQREAARAARKAGEAALRLATETLSKGSAQTAELQLAEQYLFWSARSSLAPALTALPDLQALSAVSLHTSPPNARNSITAFSLLAALHASQKSFSQALKATDLAIALASTNITSSSSSVDSASKMIHRAWLQSRLASLKTYEAEIKRAAKAAEQECLPILSDAIATADAVCLLLEPQLEQTSGLRTFKTALFGSVQEKNTERLRPKCLDVEKDARTAASSAAYLSGVMHESAASIGRKVNEDSYGANKKALDFYVSALHYAGRLDDKAELTGVMPHGKHVDESGFRRAWNALVRVREKQQMLGSK